MGRKFLTLLFMGLITVGSGYFIDWVWSGDQINIEMQNYVRESREVAARVGNIEGITLRKKLSVGRGAPYRIYTYYLKGSRANAAVEVFMDDSELSEVHRRFLIKEVTTY